MLHKVIVLVGIDAAPDSDSDEIRGKPTAKQVLGWVMPAISQGGVRYYPEIQKEVLGTMQPVTKNGCAVPTLMITLSVPHSALGISDSDNELILNEKQVEQGNILEIAMVGADTISDVESKKQYEDACNKLWPKDTVFQKLEFDDDEDEDEDLEFVWKNTSKHEATLVGEGDEGNEGDEAKVAGNSLLRREAFEATSTTCCSCSVYLKILLGSLAAGGALMLALLHMPIAAAALGLVSFGVFARTCYPGSQPGPDVEKTPLSTHRI